MRPTGSLAHCHTIFECSGAKMADDTLTTTGICAPSFPSTVLTITETATWQSLRVGLSGESVLWNRIKIGGDVAYLPYARFDGLDNHWLRDVPTWFAQWGTGRGACRLNLSPLTS